jgi:phosphoglucomutase
MFNTVSIKEHLISITKKGMDGQQQIADMMADFRNNPPKALAGSDVVQLLDYELKKGKNLKTGEEWQIKLPKSNVLQFILADGVRSVQDQAVLSLRSNFTLV